MLSAITASSSTISTFATRAGFVVAGYTRARAVERALDEGGFAPLANTLLLALTAAGAALAVATVAVVVAYR